MLLKYKSQLLLIVFIFFKLSGYSQYYFNKTTKNVNGVLSELNVEGGKIFIENDEIKYFFYDQKAINRIHAGEDVHVINLHAYSIKFEKSKTKLEIEFENESDYFENHYKGSKKNWKEKEKLYKGVRIKIYDGIDYRMYNDNNRLKSDYIIKAGYNPDKIKLNYSGTEDIYIKNNKINITTSVNTVLEEAPYAYQIVENRQVEVKCKYVLNKNKLSFTFPDGYDKNLDLIIDPTIVFSTYSGSISDNFGYTATYDDFGFLYSGGIAFDFGYPTTVGAYQSNFSGGIIDVVITKYDSSGATRIYSTYLGGGDADQPHSLVVNKLGQLYVLGTTGSNDFPVISGSFDTVFNGGNSVSNIGFGITFSKGSDIFVSRMSSNGGTLLSSTYLGGSSTDGLNIGTKINRNYADEIRGEIDIDLDNNIYVVSSTWSDDFPITNKAFQKVRAGKQEGCIVKLDYQLKSVIWSSYIGGSNNDAVYSVTIDKENHIYITGGTTSNNFPASPTAYQSVFLDTLDSDAYIAHISKDGKELLSATYYGSSFYDQSYFVETGTNNEVYIFGQTMSTGSDLIKNANYFNLDAGQFIAVFDPKLETLNRSTVVGSGKGTPDFSPTAFLVDVCNRIYLSGWGSNVGGGALSTFNLPVTTGAYQPNTDGNDFYLMVIDDSLNQLNYATFLGGNQSAEHVDGGTSRFDKNGIIYQSVCAGCGGNSDFPIFPLNNIVSATNNSLNCNNAVFKFSMDFPMIHADFNSPVISCSKTVDFINNSTTQNSTTFFWDFGDGNNSSQINPSHTYSEGGLFDVMLVVNSQSSCNITDTIIKQIYIKSEGEYSLLNVEKCVSEYKTIGFSPLNNPTIKYLWLPNINLNNNTISNPQTYTDTSINYKLLITDSICSDTVLQKVEVQSVALNAGSDTSYCNSPIQLVATYDSLSTFFFWSSSSDFIDTISLVDSFTTLEIGKYYVKAAKNNCIDIDSVSIIADEIDIALGGISKICKGDSVILIVNNLTPQNPITTYNWTPLQLLYASDSSYVWDFPDSSKTYTVEVENSKGCYIKDSVNVEVFNKPIIDSLWVSDSVVFKGESTDIFVKTISQIIWENNELSSNITVLPENDKYYKLQVYNEECIISDSILVKVRDVFCNEESFLIPTAFTPNQDNKNEEYRIIDHDLITIDFSINIYNRLGQRVFSSKDINEGWNGTFNGELLPPQVFDFYLEVRCIGDKNMFRKGNITLIR